MKIFLFFSINGKFHLIHFLFDLTRISYTFTTPVVNHAPVIDHLSENRKN